MRGTAERPRLSVYKSNRYTYVQAIDDVVGTHGRAASNLEKERGGTSATPWRTSEAGRAHRRSASRRSGIAAVVFDRNGYRYHGKVKAIADGARKAGITF